ncbi:uncharacterized protein FIESC28_05843 [Fusarium coffeatum]|uniref:CBM-cenC domain-containing protein n=1 Tax=Fusarium coffeatum TaxID=231269 RepID=A0A366RP77_9HYPO|nr:uncharacterized protein FIESC28_05843 [Fusarium coffeatum]RBR18921.1 hypothetical protein FIESC28_05843 [Fusarium coffeatum]
MGNSKMASLKVLGVALVLGFAGVNAVPCKPASLSIVGSSSMGQTTTVTEPSSTANPEIESTSAVIQGASSTVVSGYEASITLEVSTATSETTFSLTYAGTATTTVEDAVVTVETSATTVADDTTTTTTTESVPTAINYLLNAGFEEPNDDSIFNGFPWTRRTTPRGGIIQVFESNADYPARSGARSMHMTMLQTNPISFQQDVPGLNPGSQYVLSAWFASTFGKTLYCTSQLNFGGEVVATHQYSVSEPLIYEKAQVTVTASAKTDVVGIFMICENQGLGIGVLVDDLSLVETV